jgi:hypothetical protein
MADMDRGKIIKLSLAGGLFLLAIIVILVNLGFFASEPKHVPLEDTLTPEQKVEFETQQKERERMDKIIPPSGA